MSVRPILSSVVLVILIAASLADESIPILDGLQKVEESFVKILGQSSHVLSFARFTHKYGKKYKNAEEIKHRFSVFSDNLDFIRSTNKKGLSYKLGVNKFADLTEQEFKRNKIGASHYPFATLKGSHNLTERALLETTTPSEIDWRKAGFVSPVRDEGKCRFSGAMSAVGAVEAAYRIRYRIEMSLSEQQLLDCSRNGGCYGDVYPYMALEYIRQHGISNRKDYPYTGVKETCRASSFSRSRARIEVNLEGARGDEATLKQLVAVSPVTILFQATKSFRFYKTGVYTGSDCRKKGFDRSMLVVGYGVEEGVPYWLIQNSWGVDWGDKGYVKVERGKNVCNVAASSVFPVLQ